MRIVGADGGDFQPTARSEAERIASRRPRRNHSDGTGYGPAVAETRRPVTARTAFSLLKRRPTAALARICLGARELATRTTTIDLEALAEQDRGLSNQLFGSVCSMRALQHRPGSGLGDGGCRNGVRPDG
jgi:hypothetical protein